MRVTPHYKPLLVRALSACLVLILILIFHHHYNRLYQDYMDVLGRAVGNLISARYDYSYYIKVVNGSPQYAAYNTFLNYILLSAGVCVPLGFILSIAQPSQKQKSLSAEISFWIAIPWTCVLGFVFIDSLSDPYFWNDHLQLSLLYFAAFYVWLIIFFLSTIRLVFLGGKPDASFLSPMLTEKSIPLLADGSPDWSGMDSQVHCSICSYNLRGLTNPRCPECGYPFQWSELRPRSNSWIDRFFEYATHSFIRSFLFTWLRAFLPGRFYAKVTASHPIHKRRLIIILLLLILPAIPLQIVPFLAHLVFHMKFLANVPFSSAAFCDLFLYLSGRSYISIWIIFSLAPLAWITFSVFSIFFLRQTARKAKNNLWHVIRCVVYSAAPFIPLSAIAPLFMVFFMELHYSILTFELFNNALSLSLLLLWPIFLLASSAKHYLRIPHPLFTILALQLIFLLALLGLPAILLQFS